MSLIDIQKRSITVEMTYRELGPTLETPFIRAAASANR